MCSNHKLILTLTLPIYICNTISIISKYTRRCIYVWFIDVHVSFHILYVNCKNFHWF